MQRIKIDFDNPGLPKRLDVMENDAQSRFFEAELYQGGKAYSAPSGATYSIMYHGFGPQNEGWYDTINDGAGKRAACTVSGNVVTCELARQALQVPGHMTVILCVTASNGYMLKGWPITANVRNDDYNDGEEVEMYFNLSGNVSNAIEQLKKAMAEAEQAKKDIETKAAEALASIPEDYTELDSNVKQIKEDLVSIQKKQGYLSSYVTDNTIKIDNEIYDVTTIIDELLKNGCKKIVVDVDCYVQKPIIPNNGLEIVGNGKSVIYFESGDGFHFSDGSDNTSVHDLIIKGYNIQNDINVKDNWLIDISSDLHNVKLYNLDVERGYNGIKINGWINNYQNIIVSYFYGIGVYIGRSDNTYNTFYINGCKKEGLYVSSSNNRIDNIKILSCGKNSDASCYFKGSRNTISNIEIQDIYKKCAIFENFNNNILNINLDGIRTHISTDIESTLAEFVNCSRNIMNIISSKYGSVVQNSSPDDIIKLNSECTNNSLLLSSLKVNVNDMGTNNITVLKKDIISYNMDKILTLEETYNAIKPLSVSYVKCDDITNEYSDIMYAFKNRGDVTYSGLRATFTEKRKLFCVSVLSSNIAYSTQNQAILQLTDQQGNESRVRSNGNLEEYQVIILIGSDDSSFKQWAVINNLKDSTAITKIKYVGFFDYNDYSAIMSDIIN